MKITLLIFSLFYSLTLHAQWKEYNSSSIYNVLDNELTKIQTILYHAAYDGKIRAYHDYSLTNYFPKSQVKLMGSGQSHVFVNKVTGLLYAPYDTVIKKLFNKAAASSYPFYVTNKLVNPPPYNIQIDTQNCYLLDTNYTTGDKKYYIDNNYKDTILNYIFDPKNLNGISGWYAGNNRFMDNQKVFSLNAVSINYNPTMEGGISIPSQPMFYFNIKDLKNVLTKKEINFIKTFSNIFFGDKILLEEQEVYQNKLSYPNIKHGRIFEVSLNAASKEIMSTSYNIFDDIKFKKLLFKDSCFNQPLDTISYSKMMYYERIMQIAPNPNYPDSLVDTIFKSKSGFYGVIILTEKAIGMIPDNAQSVEIKNTIYIKRTDFYKNCEPWLAYILKEYF